MKRILNANTEDLIRDLDQFIFYSKKDEGIYNSIVKYGEHYFKMEIYINGIVIINENKIIDAKHLTPVVGYKIVGGLSTNGYRLYGAGVVLDNKLYNKIMNSAKLKLRKVKLDQII